MPLVHCLIMVTYRSNWRHRVARGVKRAYSTVNNAWSKLSPQRKQQIVQYIARNAVAIARRSPSRKVRAVRHARRRLFTKYKYHTTGFRGKRFKKVRKQRVSSIVKSGALLYHETGGVMTAEKTVIVGHSTIAYHTVWKTVFHALIREMFRVSGYEFADFNYGFAKDFALTIEYTYLENTAPRSVTVTFNVGNPSGTFENISNELREAFMADIQGLTEATKVSFTRMYWVETSSSRDHYLNLFNAKIEINFTSTVRLQNRTKANAGTEDAGTTNALDIENNPLHGKKYFARRVGIFPAHATTSTNHVDVDSGIIAHDGSVSDFEQPPSSYMYQGCSKAVSVSLKPGEIKTDFVKDRFYGNLNYFLSKIFFSAHMADSATAPVRKMSFGTFGKTSWFALEMMCNTRTNEPEISVGWEVDYRVGCRVATSRQGVMPIYDVA